MNSQELRALQEAYSQVYAPQELDEGYMPPTQKRADKMMKQSSKLHRTGSERGDFGNPESEKKHTQASKIAFMSRRMSDKAKERDKESKKSEFNVKEDLYDIILSHLLDEGYADTQEAAEAIMVNMSEDWRESIMEADSLAAMAARREKRLKAQRKREGTSATGQDWGHNYGQTAAQRESDKKAEFDAFIKRKK
jgi:hypothetical protein